MLKSNNVTLRPVESKDVDFLFQIENDTENWKVSGTTIPFSRKTLEDFANSTHDLSIQKQFRFVVSLNNKSAGFIDLFDYDSVNGRCGVGIIVGNEFQNCGLGTEALSLLISYSKQNLNLKQLHCSIHQSNINSIKLFTKAGFVKIGVRKDWYFYNNIWEDEILYQLILK